MEQEFDAQKQDDDLDDLSCMSRIAALRHDRLGSDRDIFEDFDHINEDFFRVNQNHSTQALEQIS